MENLKELEQYKLVELINDRMEYLAEQKNISVTSITRLTGFTDETTVYHTIRTATQLTSEKSLNKYTNAQYVRAYEMLGTVVNEMEA